MKKHFLLAGIAVLMLAACNNKSASELTLSGLDPVKFQTEVNNAQTALYTLKNKAGMEVCITNFGGRIVSIMVPDKNGQMQDVVLGLTALLIIQYSQRLWRFYRTLCKPYQPRTFRIGR